MRNVYVQDPVYSYVESERSRRDGGAQGLQEWQVGAGVMMRGDYGGYKMRVRTRALWPVKRGCRGVAARN